MVHDAGEAGELAVVIASRVKLSAAVALAAAAALAAVLVVAGGSRGDEGRLAWSGTPALLRSGPPTDHVLYGKIRNDSLKDVKLTAKDVRVLDGAGKPVRSSAVFLAAFAHGIYSYDDPAYDGDFERRRLGRIATVKPGQTLPVTVSWRIPVGARPPVKVAFGPATLVVPGV